MFYFLFLFAVALFAGGDSLSYYQIAPQGTWVDAVPVPKSNPPGEIPGQHLLYKLVDTQIHFNGAQSEFYYHIAQQVMTHEGLAEAANLSLEFSPHIQELLLHKVVRIRDGKAEDILEQAEIQVVQREKDLELQMFDGYLTVHIVLPSIQVGDVIEYAYSLKGQNPVFGTGESSSHYLAYSDSVESLYLRYAYPEKKTMTIREIGPSSFPAREFVKNGLQNAVWEKQGLSAFKADDYLPADFVAYPLAEISSYANWEQVNDWATQLYQVDLELPPHWKLKLDSLKKMDVQQQVAAVLRLVQKEIRYYGIEIGQNSHQPSLPSEVVQRGFGDCKDKTVLMVASLKYLGIESHPALVHTRDRASVASYLPTPKAFNHVILYVKIDNENYWLDPTKSPQFGNLDQMGFVNYGNALVVQKGQKDLTPIEAPKKYSNGFYKKDSLYIPHFGAEVNLRCSTIFYGNLAEYQRGYFANSNFAEVRENYENYFAQLYGGARMAEKGLVVFDNVDSNQFTVVEEYTLNHFWESDGAKSYYKFQRDGLEGYLLEPKKKERNTPLEVYHPLQAKMSTVVQFPHLDEGTFDREVWKLDRSEIAYDYADWQEGNLLFIQSEYQTKKAKVESAQVETYLESLDKINKSMTFSAWANENLLRAHLVDSLLIYLNKQVEGK